MKRYFSLLLLPALVIFPLLQTASAGAVSSSEWRAGRIIDDLVFTDKNSMNPDQIQEFLNHMVGTGGYDSVPQQCDTNGYRSAEPFSDFSGQTRKQYAAARSRSTTFTCLKNYYEVPKTSPGPGIPANNYGGKSVPAGARSAAQLIWDAAQAYDISPKVLLVTIQKESAGPLTTDDWPFENQYTYAMGAHCPDSGPNGSANCDPNYAGFSLQIHESAALMRWYLDNMDESWWAYKKPGINNIQYHPNAACGGTDVNIENRATAALYTYTPYQPNAVALSNIYGSQTDGCSSYGNRNFWRIYRDWFGHTYANDSEKMHPDGTIISDTVRVFIMENGQRRHITNPYVFASYGYKWEGVVDSTTGDRLSIVAAPFNTLAPGTLFRSDNTPVYVMDYDGTTLKKRHISLSSFNSLGYSWDEITYIPPKFVPSATHPSILNTAEHPSGSLVLAQNEGKIYRIENDQRHYIQNAAAFESNFYQWSQVKNATVQDMALPLGTSIGFREGTMLYADGGIYLVAYDTNGMYKRPVGPWECYSTRMHYSSEDWLAIPTTFLPARTGSLFTC